ncbi:MAG: carboxylating nicotinate-nucleotide diphosphorylase [Cytophagaceae bacterium]|jgi:nicotinate-nucleotide pyrophosphorylase (carboxylating)|nr:carboxylating nicotinate-nucleotide diphosphorylase [Cytophagaceae bacterium]
MYDYLQPESLYRFIQTALSEDVGSGDHTSLATIAKGTTGDAIMYLKDDGIIAGVEAAEMIFKTVDRSLTTEWYIQDGSPFQKGTEACKVSGSVHSILQAERLVLNTMQRMSGIASGVNALQKKIEHTGTKLLDSRKTTPNFRMMEKWAVAIGGGVNHRYGLFDMILIKDNHIDFAGGVGPALQRCTDYIKTTGLDLKIEIEARTLAEVSEALSTGIPFRILLDNMPIPLLKEAVALIDNKVETEASGGITSDTIVAVAECGVDFISMGAITHSYKSKDISLKAKNY